MIQARDKVHPFYRLYFTTLDPLSLLLTSLGLLLTPSFMLEGLIPPPDHTPNPKHAFLLHQLAILYLFLGIVLALVPRATGDLKVWRIVVGGTLFVDVGLVVSTVVTLGGQGRLGDVAGWRWQDWGFLGYSLWVACLRGMFLMGVGVRREEGEGKGKRA